MSRVEPRRVALVGCGAMGRLHARALRADPSLFVLVGGYDLDASAPGRIDLASFASLDEAIAEAEIVVVATPIEAHSEAVLSALAAGRDVLVEKPSGATFAEAAAMAAAARNAGRRLFVGHSERFNPAVRVLRARVQPDEIEALTIRRVAPARADAPDPREALLNLGVHDFDLAAYLTKQKLVVEWARGKTAVDVGLSAGRANARIHVARVRGGVRERQLVLETARERFTANLLVPRVEATSLSSGATEVLPLDLAEPVILQVRALRKPFHDAELATGLDGARAVLAVEQAASFLGRAELPVGSAENL